MSSMLKKKKEQKDLEEFILHRQNMVFQNTYLGTIKVVAKVALSFLTLVLVLHNLWEIRGREESKMFVEKMFVFWIGVIIFNLILHFFPQYFQYLIPCFIGFSLIRISESGTIGPSFKMNEYYIGALGLLHLFIIIVPTQWQYNSLAYAIGMVYFVLKTKAVYSSVPIDLVIATTIGGIYFFVGNFLLYSKLRSLYENILK